jgi:hypothetical protein
LGGDAGCMQAWTAWNVSPADQRLVRGLG